MALLLSKALGRSPENWLAIQDAHDFWVARQSVALEQLQPLRLDGLFYRNVHMQVWTRPADPEATHSY